MSIIGLKNQQGTELKYATTTNQQKHRLPNHKSKPTKKTNQITAPKPHSLHTDGAPEKHLGQWWAAQPQLPCPPSPWR